MSWVLWLAVIPVSGLVTAGLLRAAGVPRRRAAWAGGLAAAATGVALVALLFTALGECWGEADDGLPESWPWSPRRRFCHDEDSAASLAALGLLVVPTLIVLVATYLQVKGHRALSWIAHALLLATPVLPSLYVDALPLYRLDRYPVLSQPLLRPASGSRPARVCYVYGVAFGPGKTKVGPATPRDCVDLVPTPLARRLTADYDEGETLFALEQMGQQLTRKGLPVRPGATGVPGLVVARAYRLADRDARRQATLVA